MKHEIKFNINYHVKVKLTPYGVSCLYKNHLKDNEYRNKNNKFCIMIDDDGYYETQLWCLMQEFGEYIGMGMRQTPFETEIILVNEIY